VYILIGAYFFKIFITYENWWYIVACGYLMITGISVFLHKPISKYFVWVGTSIFLLLWVIGLVMVSYYGCNQYDYYTSRLSIALGIVIAAIALISAVYITKYLK
jgi:energy-coupling factor transporter transmembrane protein EcfT